MLTLNQWHGPMALLCGALSFWAGNVWVSGFAVGAGLVMLGTHVVDNYRKTHN